jgi:hypothetical protein
MSAYEKISSFGQYAVKRFSNIAEIAKLNALNLKENNVQSRLFEKLGRRYFSLQEESPREELLQIMEDIRESIFKASAYTEKLRFLRNRRVCPACGQRVSREAIYCQRCGIMLPLQPLIIDSDQISDQTAVAVEDESIENVEENVVEENIIKENIIEENVIEEDLIKSAE